MDEWQELLATIMAAHPDGPTPEEWREIVGRANGLRAQLIVQETKRIPLSQQIDRSRIAHVGPPPGPKSNDN